MFSWASILSGFVKLANWFSRWFEKQENIRIGEERQELRNRREHDDRVKRAQDARRRAEREFDERMSDDESPADSGG